jgi:hypothetical protein
MYGFLMRSLVKDTCLTAGEDPQLKRIRTFAQDFSRKTGAICNQNIYT